MANEKKEEKKEINAKDLVLKRYSYATESRQKKDGLFAEIHAFYRFVTEARSDGRSNIFIPKVFEAVETIQAKMTANRPQITLEAKDEDIEEKVLANTRFLDYEWDMMEMDRKLPRWIKQMLIYGTGIGKLTWKKKSSSKTVTARVFGPNGEIIATKELTTFENTYDGPEFEIPNILGLYPEPKTKNPSWWIHEYEINKELLYQNPNYKSEDIDPLVHWNGPKKAANITQDTTKKEEQGNTDKYTATINIKEYWEHNKLIVIANDGTILRNTSNPYDELPFIVIIDQEDDQDFWGIGEIEPNRGTQKALNTVERQIIDANAIRLKRPGLYNKMADIDTDELERGWSAGNMIGYTPTARGEKPIEFYDVPDVSASAEGLALRMGTYIESTTAANDYAQGSSSDVLNRTAKGAEIITEMSSDRFRQKMGNVEAGVSDLGEKLLRYNTKFVTTKQKIKVDDKWEEINPKDLNDKFSVKVKKNSSLPINQEKKKNDMLEFMEVALQFPNIFNTKTILEDVAREMVGKEPSRYLIAQEQQEEKAQVETQITEAEQEAEMEDNLMATKKLIPVSPDDDHETHLVVHEEEAATLPQDIILQHIEAHKAYLSPRATEAMLPSIPGTPGGPMPEAATLPESMPMGGEPMNPSNMPMPAMPGTPGNMPKQK